MLEQLWSTSVVASSVDTALIVLGHVSLNSQYRFVPAMIIIIILCDQPCTRKGTINIWDFLFVV